MWDIPRGEASLTSPSLPYLVRVFLWDCMVVV